ncbi:MAG TPA: ATP-binding protein [Myxococcales bacterium]|jgi:two-component system phosphate regulon sensor histidine kinase PhoR
MPFFRREPTLAEALAVIRSAMRAGTLPRDIEAELLRRHNERIFSGGGEPPGLQELLEGIPLAAALLEVGGRIAARNKAAGLFLDSAPTVGEISPELGELCARALAGWPHRREMPLGEAQIEAHVAPLTHARALLVIRDLSAERRADRVRRDFIANASHELRTPVTAIRGAAETLQDSVQLPPEARGFVDMIARHALRLTRLTDDLLDLYRLETGALQLEKESVQLLPVATAALEVVSKAAAAKNIALECEVPERLRASADRAALDQILLNLLDNAVKYTPEGGRVAVRGEGQGPAVTLEVLDTGPGIEPKHQARLFERFYRADEGRSRAQGGTGLGLAIVKHLAQAMGGEAGVQSTPQGSRFWVKLASG